MTARCTTARYALYFAPPADHPLWSAGCDWLGRDPESGATGAGGDHRADPRRYGFHATLKPPFALGDAVSAAELLDAVDRFAGQRTAFRLPALSVAALGDFVALRPVDRAAHAPGHPLRQLADDCVRFFDDFRRPPSAAETARRLAPGLDDAQRANVARWGYPHVFDRWRFHMTLTDTLPPPILPRLAADAARHFAAALREPAPCDGIALFVEDAPGADFRLLRRVGFRR
jgi:putative phosphonate metabolism protein